MSFVKFPRAMFRPTLEGLEERTVPASLISRPIDFRGDPQLIGVNDKVEVLASSSDGKSVLIQTQATNLVPNQNSPPLQTNLFLLTQGNNNEPQFTMISGRDNAKNSLGSRIEGLGVVPSIPGEQLNAVISDDGNFVAFMSSAPAFFFNTDPAQGGSPAANDPGGVDIFLWDRTQETITLVSKTSTGDSLGSFSQVSNPAISADGKVVAFVSTADARIVTGDDDYYDQAYDLAQDKTSVTSTFTVPVIVFDQFGNPRFVDFTFFGNRYATSSNTPDLFRFALGSTNPDPVSFTEYDETLDDENGFFVDGLPVGVDGDTDAKYLMHGDISVDPLGRYMTFAGTGFVVSRKSEIKSGSTQVISLNEGLRRYSFFSPGSVQSQPLFYTATVLPGGVGQAFNRNQIVRGAEIANAITSKFSGDIAFLYNELPGYAALKAQGVFLEDIVEGTYVDQNPNSPDLFYQTTATTGPEGRRLVTRQLEPREADVTVTPANLKTIEGQNGQLDPTPGAANQNAARPGSFAITADGARVLFVSNAPDLGYTIDPSDPDGQRLIPVTDANGAYDVFQWDSTKQDPVSILGTSFVLSVPTQKSATLPGNSRLPAQTNDSLVVAFQSTADLTEVRRPDEAIFNNIYLWERFAGKPGKGTGLVLDNPALEGRPKVSAVSVNDATGTLGNNDSFNALVTGGYKASRTFFTSRATNIDPDVTFDPRAPQLFFNDFPQFITDASKTIAFSGGGKGFVGDGTLSIQGGILAGTQIQPFGPRYKGELRVAEADVNGDNVPDIIVGAGPGGGPRVVVIDGFNGRILNDFFAFETRFTGGVYVAGADLDGDGIAEIIVGAGEGGGPRVQVYDGATDRLLFDQFAFEATARTGVRVAAADVNGDATPDLVVAAGIGGGPRVQVFNGDTLLNQRVLEPLANFFAYESSQRGGVYIAAGDYDGDGFADILTGGGPEGGPRVTVFNGLNLLRQDPNAPARFVDFFAFDENSRDGARPVFKNINGDKVADIVVGTGSAFPRIRTFVSPSTALGVPINRQDIIPFNDPIGINGAWVG